MRVRALLAVAAVEARARMSYRVDYWVQGVLVFAVQLGVAYAVWNAVFAESGAASIGGFTREAMIVYGAAAALTSRIAMGTEFETGVYLDVYEGSLSRFLLYPEPYPLVKYAQHVGGLAPLVVQLVLFGTALPLLFHAEGVHIGPASLAMGAVSLAVANLLWWTITLPLHAVAFWAENVWSLLLASRFISHLLGGLLVPLSAFPDWAQPALSALPFHHVFGDPIETLLGRVDPATWAQGLAVALLWALAFSLVGALAWRRGRLVYTGAGNG